MEREGGSTALSGGTCDRGSTDDGGDEEGREEWTARSHRLGGYAADGR